MWVYLNFSSLINHKLKDPKGCKQKNNTQPTKRAAHLIRGFFLKFYSLLSKAGAKPSVGVFYLKLLRDWERGHDKTSEGELTSKNVLLFYHNSNCYYFVQP